MSVQVPKGYKQTEVGVIPEDWEIPALGELITEMRGGAPFRPSDFTSSGVKVLPKGGVGRSGWLRIQDNEMQYCSPRYAFAHRRNQVNDEFTIVVLRDLVPSGPSIGLMVQIRDSESYVLAQGAYGFKVNDRVAPKYLVQLSNTSWYRKLANSIMVGSTQVHITNTAFKLAKIPLPSLDEQQAIAEALSDADALIESLERLIAKKRQIKQGAMHELLTCQRRLPGFSGEWKVNRLGDLTQMCSGGTPPSSNPDFYNGQIPWVSISDMTSTGKYIASTEKNLTNEGFASCAAKMFPSGTVLYAMYASLGECSIANVSLCTSQAILGIQPGGKIDGEYLYYYLQFIKNSVKNMGQQGTQANLNKGMVGDFLLKTPSIPEQKSIVEVLHEMDKEISNIELRLSKSQKIKQAMMQELLTGRIRLI